MNSFKKIKIPFPFIDIYFFKWNNNIVSKIHDHSKNGCLMIILNGIIKERIYDNNLNIIKKNIYKTPNISYINNKKGYHDIKSLCNNTYSVHIYHPKNYKTKYFN